MTKAYELHPHIFLSDWTNPNVALVKGKGMRQWDVNGNEYLDSCSGACNVSLGYGREDISEVIRKQAVELSYLTRFTSVHRFWMNALTYWQTLPAWIVSL